MNLRLQDVVTVAPGKIDEFEDKARHFFVEHLHACEEIRFVLDGTGYFDVRDRNDDWIRLKITRGDFIILPSGMYHRFTLDESLYIQVGPRVPDPPGLQPRRPGWLAGCELAREPSES